MEGQSTLPSPPLGLPAQGQIAFALIKFAFSTFFSLQQPNLDDTIWNFAHLFVKYLFVRLVKARFLHFP